MASADQVARLRLLVAEPTTETYSDLALSNRIDAVSGDLDRAAYEVWREKAAAYADLVNITEAGSSRANGDLHEQALAMAAHFGSTMTGGAPSGGRTIVSKLSR